VVVVARSTCDVNDTVEVEVVVVVVRKVDVVLTVVGVVIVGE